MKFDEERWVKIYVRDTPTYLSWTWQTRAVHAALLRKVDRAGRLEWPPRVGLSSLAAALLISDLDVVSDALDELAASGTIVLDRDAGWLEMPAFVAAQTASAKRSGATRTAEWRARKAAGVTPGDVTRHTRDAVTHRIEEREERDQTPTGGAGGAPVTEPATPPRPKRARKPAPVPSPRALPVLERIDEHRVRLGHRPLWPSERLDRHILARLDEGVPLDELLAAVDVRAAEVEATPATVRWFDSSSPFTGPGSSGPGGWSVSCRLLDAHRARERRSTISQRWTPPGGETADSLRSLLDAEDGGAA